MIFRRKKQQEAPAAESVADDRVATSAGVELGAESDLGDVEEPAAGADPVEGGGADAPVALDPDELDARDWRGSGPYDIAEVEQDFDADDADDATDADGDGEPRIDLGSLILTGFPGAELRLQVAEESGQIVSAMLISGNSALELGAYAAPRSGGLWAELREEMIESATEAGGSGALAEGPFGVELRRLLPVTTPEGEEGYQPSRMWVVEGPRWLLRGIVYGEAALEEGVEPPVAELLTAYRKVIVRRGDEAMAPGDLLPLTMPVNLVPAEPEQLA